MFDYFISHQHDDIAFVEKLTAELERRGFSCWYAPRNVSGSYAKAIADGIRQSRVFVLVLNERSAVSEAVLNEVEMAHNVAKKSQSAYIQPVSTQALDLDDPRYEEMMYYVRRRHFINAAAPVDYAALATALIEARGKAMGFPVVTPPQKPVSPPPRPTPPARTTTVADRPAVSRRKKRRLTPYMTLAAVALAIVLLFLLPGGDEDDTDSRPPISDMASDPADNGTTAATPVATTKPTVTTAKPTAVKTTAVKTTKPATTTKAPTTTAKPTVKKTPSGTQNHKGVAFSIASIEGKTVRVNVIVSDGNYQLGWLGGLKVRALTAERTYYGTTEILKIEQGKSYTLTLEFPKLEGTVESVVICDVWTLSEQMNIVGKSTDVTIPVTWK